MKKWLVIVALLLLTPTLTVDPTWTRRPRTPPPAPDGGFETAHT